MPDDKRLHNWMYSWMFAGSNIYFCGYCPTCRMAFTQRVTHSANNVELTPMKHPRYGCVPVDDIAEAQSDMRQGGKDKILKI